MSYYLLCSDVCSLGHCVASWTSTLPGSICDVAVRHSHILIVALNFGTWVCACRVLHPVLLHAHDGLVTFPCLWRRGSFPHSLPFYATDTASTLTTSWSRWSLVRSVPIAVGFGRFEPTISAGERPQTYALDRAANGTGDIISSLPNLGAWDPFLPKTEETLKINGTGKDKHGKQ